uniref:Uncharacterized protein n=1 Tax=Rhizophagus irregularis (strain DAOM 181602 / DAOM 197198 / MUCL 43194) TaxID=747089 RepID=U9TF39_RHIID
MVIKDNQEPVRLKLHIGDIVDLNEEFKGVAYAIKQTMVTNYVDFISRCPLYNIQKLEESR